MPAIFQLRIEKKMNKALSVRVIVICSDHILLLQDSYEAKVDRALKLNESLLCNIDWKSQIPEASGKYKMIPIIQQHYLWENQIAKELDSRNPDSNIF